MGQGHQAIRCAHRLMRRTRYMSYSLMTARSCALIAATLVCSGLHNAQAQNYPSKSIRIIVPQSAGGSTDLVARPLAQKLGDALGQSVVVDNRPGAGSVIGTDLVAKAAPDGYTLLAVAASVTMSPSLYKLPFDPVRDLAPISQLTSLPNILVVH